MVIRAVIWDLGGVLVRTEDHKGRETLAKQLGIARTKLEELVFFSDSGMQAQRGEISLERHWGNVAAVLHLETKDLKEFKRKFWGGDMVDRELIGYIRGLRPQYKTALLSNAFSNLRYVIREIWKFADVFDEMVISSEVGMVKPEPSIYHLALQRLGVAPEEAVFIDDFIENVEGANAVGMYAIHFRSSVQARAELERLLNEVNL